MTAVDIRRSGRRVGGPLLGLVVGLSLTLAEPRLQATASVLLVMLLGISHGASDHALAADVWRARIGRCWLPVFIALYLLLGAIVFLLWQHAPQAMLAAFLAVSAWHFSADGADGSAGTAGRLQQAPDWAARVAYGLLPIAGPALLHTGELGRLLAPLLPSKGDAQVFASALLPVAGFAVIALLIAVQRLARAGHAEGVLKLAAVAVMTIGLPPLVGFATYFCFIHARKEMQQRCRLLSCSITAYHARFVPTLVGGVACISAACWLLPTATSALIVGLAALTFPHMLLVPSASR